MDPKKREREAREDRERERRKVERKEKRDQRMRREKQEKSVSKTEERTRPQTGTPESTENKEVGARLRGKGGKIPPETEPTGKRKRENMEEGKKSGENGERKF